MKVLSLVLLFAASVLAADVYVRIAPADATFNYIRFVPSFVTASIGDQIIFYSAASLATTQVVTASANGTSGICVDNAALFQVAVNGNFSTPIPISGTSFVTGVRYWFKGNTADCLASNSLRGSVLIGNFGYNCSSAPNSTVCGAIGSTPPGPPYKACVWCGASFTDGFCYTPQWAGTSNCPCRECTNDYECPANTAAFFCGSTCQNANGTCPTYVRQGSSSFLSVSLGLLFAVLFISLF